MFIQIKDLDLTVEPQDSRVFYLATRTNPEIYVSRGFVGHDLSQFTSDNKENAIVYFNKQEAKMALNTEFKFRREPWEIRSCQVNELVKSDAKKSDAVKRHAKRIRRQQKNRRTQCN